MTDADGHVVSRAYYKAWGGLEALSPNVVEQNLRFKGQYHDRETGLYYNTFRYYDPAVGRGFMVIKHLMEYFYLAPRNWPARRGYQHIGQAINCNAEGTILLEDEVYATDHRSMAQVRNLFRRPST
ncbi:RHS repeat domain-containing protein [Pseudomonas sp. Fl4BN1]|uniref:RHS repeat domain-containing protein n=1 Tax=Pseudomonas sp. Fl4BN1 TaxID=2697651 RepID=UPI002114A793|nr:RHS repeat-associated core domain-containing protein [Pseudomonas sp. Fl4BN1]